MSRPIRFRPARPMMSGPEARAARGRARERLERISRERMGMPAEEFRARYELGMVDEDDPAAAEVAALLCFAA